MEYEAGSYQKTRVKQYAHRELSETAEGRYWRRFQSPLTAKQAGAVSSLDFCPAFPHHLAVTSSTRVLLYDGANRTLRRTINRFKDRAYGASWRVDGKLLAAGGQDGLVQLFDPDSRTVLRKLAAHKRPVHVARFDPDKLHILSGGDDATVRWWDITAGKQLSRWDGHTDYVRTAAPNPGATGLWATGGYDHTCKLWDARTGSATLSVDHGAPIEAVAFFPSGSMVATAGGTEVRIWDLFAGGREIACLANHQKTVTSLVVSPHAGPTSSASSRLLTGSLDAHLKVYELETFKVTHIQKYPAPIMSIGMSADAGLLAVGLSDGTLTLRRHAKPRGEAIARAEARKQRYKPALTAASYRYFIRGQSSRAAERDSVVAAEKKAALAQHDKFLRKFRYREALDVALATGRAEIIASVIEELESRGGLVAALSARTPKQLVPLLRYVRRCVADPRHSRQLSAVTHNLLDLYAATPAFPELLLELQLVLEQVRLELEAQDELQRTRGMLAPMLSASLSR